MKILEALHSIKNDISKDNINRAISKLRYILRDSPLLYEIILQESRHNSLKKDIRNGVVNFEKSKIEANKIKLALLEIVQEIILLNEKNTLVTDELKRLDLSNLNNLQEHFGKGHNIGRDQVTHIGKQTNIFEKTFKINPITGILLVIAILAIIGIQTYFLYVQHIKLEFQKTFIEQQNLSIEVSKYLTTTQFTQAYSRLRTCYIQERVNNKEQFTEDLNYVMGRFDEIAIYIQSGRVNDCIVKNNVYNTLLDFISILEFCNFPKANRQKFDFLNNHFSTLAKCD